MLSNVAKRQNAAPVDSSQVAAGCPLCARVACLMCAQAFDGADIIVHELGNNVTVSDLMERPAAVQDDRLVASRFGIN